MDRPWLENLFFLLQNAIQKPPIIVITIFRILQPVKVARKVWVTAGYNDHKARTVLGQVPAEVPAFLVLSIKADMDHLGSDLHKKEGHKVPLLPRCQRGGDPE